MKGKIQDLERETTLLKDQLNYKEKVDKYLQKDVNFDQFHQQLHKEDESGQKVILKFPVSLKLKEMFEKEKEEKGAKNLGVVFHLLITSAKKRILALEEELMRQRTMFTNQTMITAVIEAQFRQKIHRLDLWVRMMALSGSQRLIDHLRPMFPDSWIPGHTTISKAKVQCKTKQNKTKQNKTKQNATTTTEQNNRRNFYPKSEMNFPFNRFQMGMESKPSRFYPTPPTSFSPIMEVSLRKFSS